MAKGKEIAVDMADLEKGDNIARGAAVRLPVWSKLHRSSTTNNSQKGGSTVPDSAAPSTPQQRHPNIETHHILREKFLALPSIIRGHVISMLGELIGTFSFLFFAFSAAQLAMNSNHQPHAAAAQSLEMLMYISLAFGLSMIVNAWTFFRVSGGLFNPAVTFALCLVGAMTWARGGLLFVAQMIGALIAAGAVSALFPGDMSVETTLGALSNVAQGFFIETFATFFLVLVCFMLAAEKHEGRFLAPVGIGLALFVAELSSVAYTGGSLNPARSFAPAAVNHEFPSYHWIYWFGPLLGAAVAAGVYKLLKIIEYETANPDSENAALTHRNSGIPQRHSSIHRRPRTPPVFTLGHRANTGDDDDQVYQDADEWPLTNSLRHDLRSLSGFGEGLLTRAAQGSSKRVKNEMSY